MEKKTYYINGVGLISPQFTFEQDGFLSQPREYGSNVLRCVTPDFKTYINPVQLRRLSRLLRIGLSAALICLRDAKDENPDGIITSTGYGFLEDTAKFLVELLTQHEKQVTPTYFVQGTYNALGGLVALYLKCSGYNTTHVGKGFAFEMALFDAMMQLQGNDSLRFLVGSYDEADTLLYTINSKAGHYKLEPIPSLALFESTTAGTLQGEGAAFFFISTQASEQTWCSIRDVRMLYKPEEDELTAALHDFLKRNAMSAADVDVVINGASGDMTHDQYINRMVDTIFSQVVELKFKHLCGEYCTASSFAVWMGASVLKKQEIPSVARTNQASIPAPIKTVLIINQYRGRNYTFILLTGN
jgi:3-oxoacyl-(acyl-carrier-protein) synthase